METPAATTYDLESAGDELRERLREGIWTTDSLQGAALKDKAVRRIGQRLEGNKNWQAWVGEQEYIPQVRYTDDSLSMIDELIHSWAKTSGDKDDVAIALQMAAKQEFGLTGTSAWWPSYAKASAKTRLGDAVSQKGLRAFVRAMHDETQEFLKANGISHIQGFRGVKYRTKKPGLQWTGGQRAPAEPRPWGRGFYPEGPPRGIAQKGTVKQAAMSSWAIDQDTAYRFAQGMTGEGGERFRAILTSRIPAERIIAVPGRGMGCSHEYEFLVLGGPGDDVAAVAWQAAEGAEGPGMTSIIHDLADVLTGAMP